MMPSTQNTTQRDLGRFRPAAVLRLDAAWHSRRYADMDGTLGLGERIAKRPHTPA
ncbi:MAG: hypothetical protein AAF297_11795 [Planctomycetota bacterium]